MRRYIEGDEDEPNDYDRQDSHEALHTPHPLTPPKLTPSPAAAADSKVNAGPRPDLTLARRFSAECAGLVPGFFPRDVVPARPPLAVIDAIKPLLQGGKSFIELNSRTGDLARQGGC